VWQGEHLLTLTPKAFVVLHYLNDHAGQLITKDELIRSVWADTVVTDGALVACICELRKALHDDAHHPQYIETVHRRGYRFIAPLTTPPHPSLESRVQSLGSKEHGEDLSVQTLDSRRQTLDVPLVGREAELAQLHGWLDKALSGERQLVFVTGEAGIGKTTLVEKFLFGVRSHEKFGVQEREERQDAIGQTQLANLRVSSPTPNPELSPTRGVWVAVGQCIEHYGAGEAYLPVLEALGRLCRGPSGERLIALLSQYAPTWLVQMPALLSSTEYEALQRRTQGATRERMLRELAEGLEAITAERPLVLVLEDLHWSDPSTLDLLSLVARRTELARLLIIGTYRPLDVIVREHPLKTVKAELQLHQHCQELALEPLSEAQVAEYLAVRLLVGTRRTVPFQLARFIHQRTEGNPLFLVAMVDDLMVRGMILQTDTSWELQEEAMTIESRSPDSIRHLVALQSGRLSPAEQQTLEAASVAGMEFSAASVSAALAIDTAVIERWCEHLAERQHFLRRVGIEEWPDGTLAARYSFLHALYQQIWHERVSPTQLQHYHFRIGERKERAYGERAKEIATELAVHFEQGRDYGRAVHYLQQAGQNAIQCSAYQEATSNLTKGLGMLKTLPATLEHSQQELTLQVALGTPLIAIKGYAAPEVEKTYARARKLCQQVGETPLLFRVLGGLSAFYVVRGDLQAARKVGEQLLCLAQSVQDSDLLMRAHFALGPPLFFLGKFAPAQKHLEQGIALYDSQKHHSRAVQDPGVVSLSYVALALWHLGYPDQALKRTYEALTLARELAHPFSVSLALWALTCLHQYRREEHAAQEQAEAAIALSTEHGFAIWLATGTIWRGWALAEQGQIEEGMAQMSQGIGAWRATGAETMRPYFLSLLATAYGKVGQTEEGLAMLDEALIRVDNAEEREYEAELYRLKGELTLTQSKTSPRQVSDKSQARWEQAENKSGIADPRPLNPDPQSEAEACFLKAIYIARKQQAKSLELRAAMSLVRLRQQQVTQEESRNTQHEARVRLDEAHQMLSELYHWFTEGFDTKDLQEARSLLEELGR
jgi:DNA-binding winged helix-turn-helix (wHTH) protein/predicted ATPase